MQKTAIILAGGKGTRVKSLFPNVPKALIPVNNIPILERIIKQLKDFTIFINVNEDEKKYFEYLNLPLLVEFQRYGNAGAIRQFYKMLGNRFLVIHTDVLSNIDMNQLWKEHCERADCKGHELIGSVTMTVKNIGNPKSFGLVIQEYPNKVVGFTRNRFINCGVYCMDKEVIKFIDGNSFQDFDRDLFPKLIKENLLYTYIHKGIWFDIGNKEFWRK